MGRTKKGFGLTFERIESESRERENWVFRKRQKGLEKVVRTLSTECRRVKEREKEQKRNRASRDRLGKGLELRKISAVISFVFRLAEPLLHLARL